jgi:hypothetical protein
MTMTTKFKLLGLMLTALLALAGLSPPARAAEFHFEAAHTIIGGIDIGSGDLFVVNAGTVRCTTSLYSGTANAATTSEITATPTYNDCTAFGFVSTKIDVPGGNVAAGAGGGCDYKFTPSTASSHLHIVCGAGEFITVTAFNCYVKIGTQTATGTTYDNSGSGTGREVVLTHNVSGLTYTQESKSFPGCSAGTFSNGSFQGETAMWADNTTGGPAGFWHG